MDSGSELIVHVGGVGLKNIGEQGIRARTSTYSLQIDEDETREVLQYNTSFLYRISSFV